MRIESVNSVKGKRIGQPRNEVPHEGTKLREVYDLLKANPAHPVKIVHDNLRTRGVCLDQLRNVYGLDIRKFKNKKATYWLVGEYIGTDYVDYVAQRRERELELVKKAQNG